MNPILRGVAASLGVFVGAVTGGFIGFFAMLSLRQSGLIEMQEMATWPDYTVMVVCVFAGGFYGGWLVWHQIR